ncbi:MAG: stage III sporulation protein AG [Clostridiales bacterium]|nr:stage III sporulation protein AG [Clostridiales bacterium]
MSKKVKEWLEKRKRPGKDQLLILVLLGLLLAVIAIPVEDREKPAGQSVPKEQEEETAQQPETGYEAQMEQKLEELLGSVEGVGEVRVMLTFEGTGEKKVEKDQAFSADESREETVYTENGSSERTPYVTSETNPRVEGVLIIAKGGGNSRVKQEILEAAQALFGIEAHKIKIMKMEGTK